MDPDEEEQGMYRYMYMFTPQRAYMCLCMRLGDVMAEWSGVEWSGAEWSEMDSGSETDGYTHTCTNDLSTLLLDYLF